MRSIVTSVAALLALAAAALAQPQVAYIIPDIGAAGMNTYVEIVAPAAASGSFGGSGLFVNSNNGSETVGIGPANPADTNRILVGPIVSSWGGRILSTQIFVKPGAANGVVPLRVTVSGQSTTVDFEIVTPQVLGAAGVVNGGGALGSGGPLGTRSKRGAMIVENLVLGTGTYTVATSDPDASTAGNQGYLPFILISRGNLAVLPTATLNVNGSGANGGPGGGGGAGQVCDYNPIQNPGNGSAGGDGYSGGGGGGKNGSGSPHVNLNIGNGSGAAGASLSGATAGTNSYNCSGPESAGAGTGHPFGTGGGGSCNLAGSVGGNGGGGGNGQTGPGAGGGFGTSGGNGSGSSTNGGKVHGNAMGVPVAGGSGGGGGNPQAFPPVCAGRGGGGGGAMVLYSQTILNGTAGGFSANGVDGGTGSPAGGGGSGGFIALGAKIPSAFGGSGTTAPGIAGGGGAGVGGQGRGRYDGFVSSAPSFNNAVSTFIGPTIDTLTYIQGATFTLQGTFDGTNTPTIYMRSAAGVFAALPAPATTGRVWSVQVTVPNSGLYYFVAMQPVPGANPNDANVAQPTHVMSQAGANIVRVDLIPKISVDSATVTFLPLVCRSDSTIDSVKVYNTGDTTLRITTGLGGANPGDFSILNPGTFNIAPRDSMVIRIRFRATAPGSRTATLILTNTDPRPGKNPTIVQLIGFSNNMSRMLDKNMLDFGQVCRDSASTLRLNLQHDGEAGGAISAIVRRGTGPAVFTITTPAAFPSNFGAGPGTTPIDVRFRPTSVGAVADSFLVIVGPCNDTLRFAVRGEGVVTDISISPDPLDFGDVRLTTTGSGQAILKNNGASPVTITAAFVTPGGSPFTLVSNPVGQTVAGGGSLPIDLSFTPPSQGVFNARLCVVAGGVSCPDTACVDLTGRGTTSLIILSRRTVLLEADSCSDAPGTLSDTFHVYNRGTAPVRINTATSTGTVAVATAPGLPTDLAPGDSITVTVTWTPGTTGTDRVTITTDASDPAQQTLTVDVTLRRERVQYEVVDGSGGPLPPVVDVGNLFPCVPPNVVEIELRNTGSLADTISASFSGGGPFVLSPAPLYALGAGESRRVRISLSGSTSGTFSDTLVLTDLCGRQTSIPVVGGSYTLSFVVTGINFGTSNVGVPRTGTARLQNTSGTPNNVKVVVGSVTLIPAAGSPFTITRSDIPDTLAPNEVTAVDVDFTPTSQTGFSGQICFHITEPCDTTLCVPMNGTGIQSSVLVRKSSLNYGTLFLCQDSTLSLSIVNTGTAPLNLQGLAITGTDAALFEETPPTSTPQTIAPGDSVVVTIRFVPGRSGTDGAKTATLEITTDDPAQPLIRVSLLGERRRQFLATPVQLDFGRVDVGTVKEDTVTLDNRTGAPLVVSSLQITPPFSVVGTIPPGGFPRTLAPGDSIRVRVLYTPTDTSSANAELLAVQSQPCPDTTRVQVQGRGHIPQQGTASIVIPSDLMGAPGERISVPIVLEQGNLISEAEATTFELTLRFRASMLIPVGARAKGDPLLKPSIGSIKDSRIEGADRVVTVRVANNPVPIAPDTLGFVDMMVAIGDARQTPITLDTIVWIDGDVTTTTVDGLFTVDSLCTIGGERLVRGDGAFGLKQARPNPFNPSTDITFDVNETGGTSLRIYDLYGRLIHTLVDGESLAPGRYARSWDATAWPSGLYLAVLTSSTQRSVLSLVLVK